MVLLIRDIGTALIGIDKSGYGGGGGDVIRF